MNRETIKPLGILSWLAVFALALLFMGCGRAGEKRPNTRRGRDAAASDAVLDSIPPTGQETAGTHTEMKGLSLRMMKGVVMEVPYLTGTATPLRSGDPVILDDPASYKIHVDAAESRIAYADLANLMNDHVFAYKGAPIQNLRAEREHDEGEEVRLELKGHLAKLAGIPFEMEGTPEVTPDGRIRVRTRSMQSIGIKIAGLMDFLGLEAEDIIHLKKERGIEVDGNDMILDPSRLLPPPQASGQVTSVALEPDGFVMRFGSPPPPSHEENKKEHFIKYRGGTIRLGRMTMTDADLQIFDAEPGDAFDFSPSDINRQISAGYVKVQLHGGLVIFAPDYAHIHEADLRPPATH